MRPKQASTVMAVRLVLTRASLSTSVLGRDAQEHPNQYEIRHHGAASVAHEWQGDAGQRDQLERTAKDDERLKRDDRGQTRREQQIEARTRVHRDKKTALQ